MTKDSVVSRKIARALGSAMWMYDLTGGWRIGKFHKRLSAKKAAKHFPTTHIDKLSSAYLYFDAAADDARLVITIARTAARKGAVVANGCAVVDITAGSDGKADGALVEADGEQFAIKARVVINATGVWADDVRAMDEGTSDDSIQPDSIRPAKGTHLVIPWALTRNDIAVIIPVRSDKRSLFLNPWGDNGDGTFAHTYVGTTDTDYDGPLDTPQCTDADIDYMLEALNQALTTTITRDDITGVWAGLRPLVKTADSDDDDGGAGAGGGQGDRDADKTTDLSRNHKVAVSETGVVRVSGGKLTTYREMAEDTVEAALGVLGESKRVRGARSTRKVKLIGARGYRPATSGSFNVHLGRRYGTLAPEVKALIAFQPNLGEPIALGHPYALAEVVYSVRHEMAIELTDVLMRRTRLHIFDRAASLAAAPKVAALMAAELGWDDAKTQQQLANYRQVCAAEEAASNAPVTHITD
jgi:glycerol-3-phosphate dehydrogenase